jgi:hypothetical protein
MRLAGIEVIAISRTFGSADPPRTARRTARGEPNERVSFRNDAQTARRNGLDQAARSSAYATSVSSGRTWVYVSAVTERFRCPTNSPIRAHGVPRR